MLPISCIHLYPPNFSTSLISNDIFPNLSATFGEEESKDKNGDSFLKPFKNRPCWPRCHGTEPCPQHC
ncbi:hypothetical protein CKAN_01384600 [Cinnamomum micranthum f. kanehirae]|uniref:Uncharacterized protein n=1 Tax=Cinnamomum micranthum f. kanehirae TaxID=337451 RepID=A0A443P2T3_9MAGN|nr:hypothetical protein CKAN_01384600 [Cinnamomum micranthum f. kanehirae]